jgi:(p)ppGpp synthase/HD superfamily hydrolase
VSGDSRQPLSAERFGDAVRWAIELHGDQVRKGTAVPYVSHLLAVAALVLEGGGSEDEAIAAVLHDALEDTDATAGDIEERFGSDVAQMVVACTDTTESPKPPWRPRKEAYVRHLADATTTDGALRVAAADKLHNARSILADLRREGDQLWTKFNAGPDEQLWYYRSLVDILSRRLPGPLTDELASVVGELERAIISS